MRALVDVVAWLNLVAFGAVAAVTLVQWATRRDRAALWAVLTFGALGIVIVVGRVLPDHPRGFLEVLVQRVDIAILVLFPYLLFRFTMTFRPPSPRLYAFVTAMSSLLVVWTFSMPHVPEEGEARPPWFIAFLVAFLIHWTVLSVASALRLWRAGRRQPSVARRRMRMLAFASAALTLAIVLVALVTDSDSPVAAAGQLLALVSAVGFLLALAPPSALRVVWRRPEQDRLQQAIQNLIALATSREEVARRVLEPASAIVGAQAIAIRDADGSVVAAHGDPGNDGDSLEIAMPSGTLLVWANPYAPYFGSDELALLRTLGALTGLALDRVRLFEQERAARVELERANQVKANFVALAAHELRTPVTTIHGFVQTLHRLGDRLSADEQAQLRVALEQQTERMASLVEQLLDLSRLDADAIDIAPEPLRVRECVEDVVRAAAAGRAGVVEIDVSPELEALADANAFERIVTNLVTNALKYGDPPVIVHAEQTDRHFRLSVEDRGRGVAPEFVPDLFERFTRSESSRERRGTGLGLAIAQAYARAHDGDLVYEAAQPHGARFRLVLPKRAPVTT